MRDQIFLLSQILQKYHEHQISTHHLFINFKAANDSIDREELRKIMHEDGYPGKLKCSVKISGAISNPIESRKGLQ